MHGAFRDGADGAVGHERDGCYWWVLEVPRGQGRLLLSPELSPELFPGLSPGPRTLAA